jgi:formylglycine-generating enzyme required for sulfatase activity
VSQEGSRIKFVYDIIAEAGEKETEVDVSITVDGKAYKSTDLHLDGAFGKVMPGKEKIIYWNLLQEFPQGLNSDFSWEITAVGGKTFTDKNTGIELVSVKGGCYSMGDTSGDGYPNEKPVHKVCVSNFYIGKYEVTQGQWKRVMGSNPSRFSSCGENCPVENVSWNDVQEFIGKLNRQSGKNYRLPTEAEWEYAARSGGKSQKYSGGDDLDSVGWYSSNSGGKTHPVGQKRPNGLGIYDMTGNVWEWCSDWHGDKYYSESPRDNPMGPSSGSTRVGRGGSWGNLAAHARASLRFRLDPDSRDVILGFRLVAPRGQ